MKTRQVGKKLIKKELTLKKKKINITNIRFFFYNKPTYSPFHISNL